MVAQNKVVVKYLWAILLCFVVGGCTSLDSTKPNEPFHGSYATGSEAFYRLRY
jgi:hypothetical protein